MKTILPESINSVQEAKDFLAELFSNREGYHPEDDALFTIFMLPDEQVPTFEERHKLNKLMNDIYALDETGVDFDPCGYIIDELGL